MPAPRKRRTQIERRDESERKMLEAGARLMAERGLEKLNLADVGVEAGYSRGLPAHHFGAKENFLIALANFIADQYKQEVASRTETLGLGGLVDLLRRACGLANDPMRVCISYIVHSGEARIAPFDTDLGNLKTGSLIAVRKHIIAGMKNGEIRKGPDPKRLASLILLMLWTLQGEWMRNRRFDLARAGDELLDVLVQGIATSDARRKLKAAA